MMHSLDRMLKKSEKNNSWGQRSSKNTLQIVKILQETQYYHRQRSPNEGEIYFRGEVSLYLFKTVGSECIGSEITI